MANNNQIQIQEATHNHIPSLTTILPRSFHPVNPFHVKVFPNTPKVREWWTAIFTEEVQNPACHPLVAIDPSASPDVVIGVLALRLLPPTAKSAGFWSMHGYTSDHAIDLFQPAIDAMIDYQAKLFENATGPHYLLEFFGVDHEFKGGGIGRMLLDRACEVADREGYEIFVESNGPAKSFYEKFGFVEKGRIAIPLEGGGAYDEILMVREVGK